MQRSYVDFVTGLTASALPVPVRRIMRRSFLDAIGVAAAGSVTANADIARRAADMLMHAGPSTGAARMLMDGRRVSAAGAALAGAATIDAHDGTSPCRGHAGSAVLPSLLAMADAAIAQGAAFDGAALMALQAIGYEVSYRAGLAQHATCADYHTSVPGPRSASRRWARGS